jgi:hypothetical protein
MPMDLAGLLALVTPLVLIIAFAVVLAIIVAKARPFRGFRDALQPSFEGFNVERATTQTLNLLITAMLVFGAVIIAWAIGAGVMRAAWLYAAEHQGFKTDLGANCGSLVSCDTWRGWLFFSFVFLFEIARAVGGVLVIGFAAGLAGAIIGFIFGIPSQISAVPAPPAAAGGVVPARGADQRQAANAWRLSTNLTQISAWLTTAIIGVLLVEAKGALDKFFDFAKSAASWLFEIRHGSPAVLAAVMLGCAVFGFLYAYLYADLIISRLIVAVDRGLQPGLEAAAVTLQGMTTITEALVPRISRSSRAPEVSEEAKPEEVKAALQYIGIAFSDISRAGVTPDEIRSWARAKALLNDYRSAAQGYIHLLGLNQPGSDPGLAGKDPHLLVEAARVFNAAGADYRSAAELVAELALKAVQNFTSEDKKDRSKLEIRRAAYGDAAALRLSGRIPGGYREALKLLDEIMGSTDPDPDPDGRLHLLRALARGQGYKELKSQNRGEAELQPLRDPIAEDLEIAFQHHDNLFQKKDVLKNANRRFWQPEPGQVDEDDLKAAYEDAKPGEKLATLLEKQ